jgi:hypothetical protein
VPPASGSSPTFSYVKHYSLPRAAAKSMLWWYGDWIDGAGPSPIWLRRSRNFSHSRSVGSASRDQFSADRSIAGFRRRRKEQ